MNVREFREYLEQFDDDYEIEISANFGEYVFGFNKDEIKVNDDFKLIVIDC